MITEDQLNHRVEDSTLNLTPQNNPLFKALTKRMSSSKADIILTNVEGLETYKTSKGMFDQKIKTLKDAIGPYSAKKQDYGSADLNKELTGERDAEGTGQTASTLKSASKKKMVKAPKRGPKVVRPYVVEEWNKADPNPSKQEQEMLSYIERIRRRKNVIERFQKSQEAEAKAAAKTLAALKLGVKAGAEPNPADLGIAYDANGKAM